jgi:hypothetical protein
LPPRTIFLIQFIAGAAAGLVLAALTGAILSLLFNPVSSGMAGLGIVVISLLYPFGVAAGVVLAGRRLDYRGKFWHSLVGAYTALLAISLLAGTVGLGPLLLALQVIYIVLSPLFSTIAYHRFGRPLDPPWDSSDDDVDLLKYHEEGWEDD